jgi:hypothetical protein
MAGFLCLQSFASPLQLNILHETLVFKGLLDLRNTEARAAVSGQRRNTIKTSYVSILRLPSFYLHKLQTI